MNRERLAGEERGIAQRRDDDHRDQLDGGGDGGGGGEGRQRLEAVVDDAIQHTEAGEALLFSSPRPVYDQPSAHVGKCRR